MLYSELKTVQIVRQTGRLSMTNCRTGTYQYPERRLAERLTNLDTVVRLDFKIKKECEECCAQ